MDTLYPTQLLYIVPDSITQHIPNSVSVVSENGFDTNGSKFLQEQLHSECNLNDAKSEANLPHSIQSALTGSTENGLVEIGSQEILADNLKRSSETFWHERFQNNEDIELSTLSGFQNLRKKTPDELRKKFSCCVCKQEFTQNLLFIKHCIMHEDIKVKSIAGNLIQLILEVEKHDAQSKKLLKNMQRNMKFLKEKNQILNYHRNTLQKNVRLLQQKMQRNESKEKGQSYKEETLEIIDEDTNFQIFNKTEKITANSLEEDMSSERNNGFRTQLSQNKILHSHRSLKNIRKITFKKNKAKINRINSNSFKISRNNSLSVKKSFNRLQKMKLRNALQHYKVLCIKNINSIDKMKCDLCNEVLNSPRHLRYHLNIHYEAFKCDFCAKCFGYNFQLENHLKVSHLDSRKRYYCGICQTRFHMLDTRNVHVKTHYLDSSNNASCDICNEVFASELHLNKHVISHFDLQYTCDLCGKSFKSRARIKEHIKNVHSGAYSCKICAKQFKTEYYARFRHLPFCKGPHKRAANGVFEESSKIISYHSEQLEKESSEMVYNQDEKQIQSHEIIERQAIEEIQNQETEQIFHNNIEHVQHSEPELVVIKHEYIEQNLNDFPVDFLGSFETKTLLETKDRITEHLSMNKALYNVKDSKLDETYEARKFRCDKCNKSFKSLHMLKGHLNTHLETSKCSYCSQIFSYNHLLKTHVRKMHEDYTKAYHCGKCQTRFLTFKARNIHALSHFEDNTLRCDICTDYSEVFESIDTLFTHLKTHFNFEFVCDYCGKSFEGKGCLTNHIKTHKKDSRLMAYNKDKKQVHSHEIMMYQDSEKLKNQEAHQILHKNFEQVQHKEPEVVVIKHENIEQNLNDFPADFLGSLEKKTLLETKDRITEYSSINKELYKVKNSKLDEINKKRKFQCDKCNKSYKSLLIFKRHLTSHLESYKCLYCSQTFAYNYRLKSHVQKMHEDYRKVYHCGKCQTRFFTFKIRNIHALSHFTDNTLRCDICTDDSEVFDSKEALFRHLKTHFNFEFICDYCGKSFKGKGCLTVHIKTHFATMSYCDICSKEYKYIKRHMRCHGNDKRYECPFCRKKFTSVSLCRRHTKIHTGELYKCEKCDMGFRAYNNLLAHNKEVHSELKLLYYCSFPGCHKKFVIKSVMVKHMKTHTEQKTFLCTYCGKAYSTKAGLDMHTANLHTHEFKFQCDFCAKWFASKAHLERHVLGHTGYRPYICNFCGKGFKEMGNLNQHLISHTKEKPKKCKICLKGFLRNSFLFQHMQKEHPSHLTATQ